MHRIGTHYLSFTEVEKFIRSGTLPKLGSKLDENILKHILRFTTIEQALTSHSKFPVYYHNVPLYWIRAMNFIPFFWNERDGEKISSHVKKIYILTEMDSNAITSAIKSNLFYWWFILLSNCRDFTTRGIHNFPIGIGEMQPTIKEKLVNLCQILMEDYKKHSYRKKCTYKTTGKVIFDEYYPKHSKPIINEIDSVLAEHYGFTDEEFDFVINYDIKYRIGINED